MAAAKIVRKVCSRLEGGHRRAGFFFGREPVDVELTPTQLQAIEADKNLIVIDPAKPSKPAQKSDPSKTGGTGSKPADDLDNDDLTPPGAGGGAGKL